MDNNLKNKKGLVLGEDTRSFLSVIRSLAESEMIVDVVTFSNTSPALKSKYIRNIYKLNYQAYTELEWQQCIVNLLNKNQYDVVFPCDERALFPLIQLQFKVTCPTQFALPNESILPPLFNKVETRFLAEKCGIPVANGSLLNLTDYSFDDLTQQFNLPLVLKPLQSYSNDELNARHAVKICRTDEEFTTFKAHNAECLVEEYFTGYGVGVSILADNGNVIAAFAHARVSEPESGGGSSYRKAICIDFNMLDACQKYCTRLKYTGVAMFEFKLNPDTQEWILIEVNARFWGSLPLAIFAGVDFPSMYAKVLLGLEVYPKLTYNQNAYARNFSSDIYAMQKEFVSNKQKKGTALAALALVKRLASFARLLTGNEKIDSFQWSDQAPFWQEYYDLFKDKVHKLPYIRERLQQERINHFCQKLSPNTNNILFVCYGNIMRSPFAAKLFSQKITKSPLVNIRVDSYGFHRQENRHAKAACIEMAKNWDIDLANHRSKWLKYDHLVDENTIVVILDKKNEYLLQSYYPEVNYISLADIIPKNMGFYHEITDPYDMPSDYLQTCYELIDASIDELIKMLITKSQ